MWPVDVEAEQLRGKLSKMARKHDHPDTAVRLDEHVAVSTSDTHHLPARMT